MENLSNISVIRDVLSRHGFSFSKGLGQNFLINPTVCPRMAEMGNAKPGWGIIEIGAGVGVLTAELARRADKVVCIEIDSRLLPVLDETLAEFDNIKIVNEDVLKVDLHRLIEQEFAGMPVAVCANLPYYITSPIIMNLLEAHLPIASLTVMVQKEVADRMQAGPGSKDYGALSLAVQYYADPYIVANVPPNCFMPRPNVGSAVIRLQTHVDPPVKVKNEKLMFGIIRASFNQRRKTLQNSVSHDPGLGISKELIAENLEKMGLSATIRGEALSLQQFAQFADLVEEARQ